MPNPHFLEKVQTVYNEWKPDVTDDLMRESYIFAPKRTGRFASMLYPLVFSDKIEIHDADWAPRAIWIRDGTLPHMIFPIDRRALKFEMGGATVFAANVHHPGTRPNAWGDEVLAVVGPRQLARLAIMIDAG